jgi:hypothetical protein
MKVGGKQAARSQIEFSDWLLARNIGRICLPASFNLLTGPRQRQDRPIGWRILKPSLELISIS